METSGRTAGGYKRCGSAQLDIVQEQSARLERLQDLLKIVGGIPFKAFDLVPVVPPVDQSQERKFRMCQALTFHSTFSLQQRSPESPSPPALKLILLSRSLTGIEVLSVGTLCCFCGFLDLVADDNDAMSPVIELRHPVYE